MNCYVIVEGDGEKKVYKNWIPLINPQLNYVERLDDLINNNYAIYSGGGYPNYYKVIENAIGDINASINVDRFIIIVDSEEMTYQEKCNEIENFIAIHPCRVQFHIIIQHFCLETWGLGNRSFPRRNTTNQKLRSYYSFFNVIQNDPELLPEYIIEDLNRAQFSLKYLSTIVNDRNPRITYSKSNPKILIQSGYFEQLRGRLNDTSHIQSFSYLLVAFN
jgi:hypothetical protein